jgi:hypothetical protein
VSTIIAGNFLPKVPFQATFSLLQARCRFRFHELRRSFASLLPAKKVPMKMFRERRSHRNTPDMTKIPA